MVADPRTNPVLTIVSARLTHGSSARSSPPTQTWY